MIVIQFVGHDSMGGEWNKVGFSGENVWFVLGQLDHDFTDNIDGSMVDKNFQGGRSLFGLILAIWDVAGDKANFNVETFVGHFFFNEGFYGVAMMHSGGKFANESSQDNIIGGGKSMGAKENAAFGEPFKH